MATACEALDFPVVSGNVSLYNETEGRAILPTPAIGGLGVLEDAAEAVGIALPPVAGPGADRCDRGDGSASRCGCARSPAARRARLRRWIWRRNGVTGDFVRMQILRDGVRACHDVSDGGLLVAVAEMAYGERRRGAAVDRAARYAGARLLVRRGPGDVTCLRWRTPRRSFGPRRVPACRWRGLDTRAGGI